MVVWGGSRSGELGSGSTRRQWDEGGLGLFLSGLGGYPFFDPVEMGIPVSLGSWFTIQLFSSGSF